MIRKTYLPFGKPNFSEEEIAAVARVLRSGWVGMGPETIAFEKELSAYVNAPYVLTVNSCTSALFLALLVLGIGPGDEVICPSLTWCSTANAALYLGAKPIFCDVDPDTLCVTPSLVKEKMTPKTRAVIIVHFGGLAVNVDQVQSILPEHVKIIEDAAHALGGRFIDGRPVGSSGNLTCFSFYANKNLSTAEGGAIALFDEKIAEKLDSLRQNAMPTNAWKRFSYPGSMNSCLLSDLGYKMNYTDMQACIGRIQLKRQKAFQKVRLDIAEHYYEHLHKLHLPIQFQSHLCHPFHARHLFVVQLPVQAMSISRNDLLLELRSRNIGASIHYSPLHTMPLYADGNYPSLPNTEKICERSLTLPISSSMTLEDAGYVVAQFKKLIR